MYISHYLHLIGRKVGLKLLTQSNAPKLLRRALICELCSDDISSYICLMHPTLCELSGYQSQTNKRVFVNFQDLVFLFNGEMLITIIEVATQKLQRFIKERKNRLMGVLNITES
ncbi:hypothetical protein PHYBLDRAFT_61641 [Phycomyces blakesleeanus NRRL 1555(-)]|uniref:Uncharacterized protein n=1 Tax=Phycomyces blakesleeanus (strain ATCC 8743b / DSM 1359 / FGSC 10004 / NBRC 33097 / NRRL 1555) TaxID=763407 RepID=A0A163EPA3_PHYB8|nr:hypothetical protein PHYBLDRAFT_61641 [Phycomyces blakesleeanus NRRL 1555(-)]OAD80590.1 hypothetical protein PHYBLDRAFT_61641 [Phycomyces blakesleeanus NRRL 1555(-)]|eukprot:XP_018298630.1 hypothetical protein PHYBLDRAFT_61641 [Phycomyces blakesleeanus NRRL 1555(-)]